MRVQDENLLVELLDENFVLQQAVDAQRIHLQNLNGEWERDFEHFQLLAAGLLVAGVLLMFYGLGV